MKVLKQIFSLLEAKERKQVYFCFLAMLLMAFVDVVGVASIMPFMAVISDPDAIMHHAKLALLYQTLHFTHHHSFLLFLGLLVLFILIISNTISLFTTWAIFNFTYQRQYSLSRRLMVHYLAQPYAFFLHRNTAELSKNILSEVTTVICRAFIPLMQLIAKLIVTCLILLLLVVIDPVLAIVLLFILGGAYTSIYIKVRKKLALISKRSLEDNQHKHKIMAETFEGIKDIKLSGRENYFIDQFSVYAKQHAEDEATGNSIAHLPRFALETIAFGGVLVIVLYLLMMQKNMINAMPLLALYAFASFRLMPAMQQIFTSVTFLRLSRDALKMLTRDLAQPATLKPRVENDAILTAHFEQLTLKDVSFTYSNSTRPVLAHCQLTIPANTTIGIVGATGAGKTTIADIILGLLIPQQGELQLDSQIITAEALPSWQRRMGYVPQHIYLADVSIKENIAFGVEPHLINQLAIEKAAKLANIHDFIYHELSDGYQTVVGERGIRLSGGQRQRIGIARALYHDPDILVLDEATSALDTITEDIILEAIQTLSRKKTIILIAHRLSTLTECDKIVVLDKGVIVSENTYQGLIDTCPTFQKMARMTS